MASSTEISCVKSGDIDKEKWNEIILEPERYIGEKIGKDVRGKLVHAFNHWFMIPEEMVDQLIKTVRTLHDLSLLIDDIQDGATLRRGRPVGHSVYGIQRVINSVQHAHIRLRYYLDDTYPDKAVARAINAVYQQQTVEAFRGQGKDLYWRDFCICPTEEEYKKMVIQKTGSIFFLITQTMQVLSEKKVDLTKLIESISLYCQIQNDYQNLACDEVDMHNWGEDAFTTRYLDVKNYCDDLTEGKFGFPLVHAINNNPIHKEEILGILKERPTDFETKRRCMKLVEGSGSMEYTRQVVEQLKKDMLTEISKLGGNGVFNEILLEWFTAKA